MFSKKYYSNLKKSFQIYRFLNTGSIYEISRTIVLTYNIFLKQQTNCNTDTLVRITK